MFRSVSGLFRSLPRVGNMSAVGERQLSRSAVANKAEKSLEERVTQVNLRCANLEKNLVNTKKKVSGLVEEVRLIKSAEATKRMEELNAIMKNFREKELSLEDLQWLGLMPISKK